jgi:hypothetical protein
VLLLLVGGGAAVARGPGLQGDSEAATGERETKGTAGCEGSRWARLRPTTACIRPNSNASLTCECNAAESCQHASLRRDGAMALCLSWSASATGVIDRDNLAVSGLVNSRGVDALHHQSCQPPHTATTHTHSATSSAASGSPPLVLDGRSEA